MAEITDKKKSGKQPTDSVRIESGSFEIPELEGFTAAEMLRLVRVKSEIARGHYTDSTPEHRRLLFVQWLVEHERLHS